MRSATRVALGALLLCVNAACGGSGGGSYYGGAAPASPPGGGSGSKIKVFVQVSTPAGQRLAHMAVFLNGTGPYLTNDKGVVEVSDVDTPYDAVVVDGAAGTAYVYEGATRISPVFEIDRTLSQHSFQVEGNVVGGTPTPGPDTRTVLVILTAVDGTRTEIAISPFSGYIPNTGNISWEGPPDTDVHLIALQYEVDADGLPTTFSGYGRQAIHVQDGDYVTSAEVILDPVPTSSLSGLDFPAGGYERALRQATVRLDDGIYLRLPQGPVAGPLFSFQVPVIPDAVLGLSIAAMSPTGSYVFSSFQELPAPSTSLSLTLGTGSDLALPYDGATGVDYETLFALGPDTGGRVHEIVFQPVGPGPVVVLRTAETVFTLPDLTALAMGLPAGAEVQWMLTAWEPAASIDDTLVEGYRRQADPADAERHVSTTTYWWSFTME